MIVFFWWSFVQFDLYWTFIFWDFIFSSVHILWLYTICVGVGLNIWHFDCYHYFIFLCRRLWIEEEKHVLSQLQDIGQVCKYGVFVSFWNKPSQYPMKFFYPVHTYQTHKIKHRSTQLLNIVKFIENLFLINEL